MRRCLNFQPHQSDNADDAARNQARNALQIKRAFDIFVGYLGASIAYPVIGDYFSAISSRASEG